MKKLILLALLTALPAMPQTVTGVAHGGTGQNATVYADTGAANAYAVALNPAITAYPTGNLCLSFKAAHANTTASTLAVNGLAVKAIKKLDALTALVANDIVLNQIVRVCYDGTNFQMVTPVANAASGAVSSVGASVPADFAVAGSPVTSSGTLAITRTTETVSFSATPTFNCKSQEILVLTGNVTSSTLTGCTTVGQEVVFAISQDGTGGRTVVFPTTVKGAAAPTSTLSVTTFQRFRWDGTNLNAVSPAVDSNGAIISGSGAYVFNATAATNAAGTIHDNGSGAITSSKNVDADFSGQLGLAHGGTNVDLSAAGGAVFTTGKQVVKQDASHVITAAALINTDLPAATLASGTNHTLVAPREYWLCTGTCTVTPPTPAAGYEFCVRNANNVATVITLAAIASTFYENQARTGYGTANTALTMGGAKTDQICIVGLDATHYLLMSVTGTATTP